jgi:hypothetical protein
MRGQWPFAHYASKRSRRPADAENALQDALADLQPDPTEALYSRARRPCAVQSISHEKDVPAQEAQARPYARFSCTDAYARWSPDDQAAAQEGTLAPDRLGLLV